MARVTLAFLVSLAAYLAYYALHTDAQPIGSLVLASSGTGHSQSAGPAALSDDGNDSDRADGGKHARLKDVNRARGKIRTYERKYPGGGGYQPFRRTGPLQLALKEAVSGTASELIAPDTQALDVGKLDRVRFNFAGYLTDGGTLLDDDDEEEEVGGGGLMKRFDDYGHMRFGKRGGEGDQFDDYGHMRFGR